MKRRCKHCGRKAEFYPSNKYKCKNCLKQAAKESYGRRRHVLKMKYHQDRAQRLEYAREAYHTSKQKHLLRARLYYRSHKAHPTVEDQFIIEELQSILAGQKTLPDHCEWCGSTRTLNPFCPEAEQKVRWLCLHCHREVRSTKTKGRQRAVRNEKRPQLPRWLRRIVGRRRPER